MHAGSGTSSSGVSIAFPRSQPPGNGNARRAETGASGCRWVGEQYTGFWNLREPTPPMALNPIWCRRLNKITGFVNGGHHAGTDSMLLANQSAKPKVGVGWDTTTGHGGCSSSLCLEGAPVPVGPLFALAQDWFPACRYPITVDLQKVCRHLGTGRLFARCLATRLVARKRLANSSMSIPRCRCGDDGWNGIIYSSSPPPTHTHLFAMPNGYLCSYSNKIYAGTGTLH